MARIEWVKQRLENWALYKERESRGGLGYATQSSFLNEATTDRYRESRIPVDDVDAGITDQAVESLRASRGHLHLTLQYVYLKGLGHRESARRMGVVESTITARLDEADRAIAQWFSARQEATRRHVVNA